MKHILRFAFCLILLAPALFAGVTYEFSSITEGADTSRLVGTASVEGSNMRLEVQSGDGVVFQDGSVVISKDGGSTLLFLDPSKKTYYEMRLDDLMNSMGSILAAAGGAVSMNFENQKIKVTPKGAGETIEGYATRRYTVDTSYDLVMKVMGMTMKMETESTSEVWATPDLARDYIVFIQQKGFKTGIADLDELIEKQVNAIEGFPLRQVITSKVTTRGRSETSKTTVNVSNIQKKNIADGQFEIPAGYRRTESPAVMPGMTR